METQEIINKNPDSISIGNSKTGEVKVYFDALNPKEAEEKLKNAIAVLLAHRKEVLGD